MTINEYKASCIRFARDSKNWSAVDPHRFYMASGNGEWYESCDADRGGISVAWIFEYRNYLAAGFDLSDELYRGAYLAEYESALRAAEYNGTLSDEETAVWLAVTFEDAVTLPDGTLTVMSADEWEAVEELMDEELLAELRHWDFYPVSTKSDYLSAYRQLHREKYGEEFTWI